MGNLVPHPQWVDVPYFEANAVLTGGPDCPDNLPLKALADRPECLKGMVEHMSLGFAAVPATNKGLFIVVKQPHTRMMMWNGTQYVRAPWHQPCQLFFSYYNPASISGALPVRGDVSYQQSNYPDVVGRLGLSGVGTFTLVEARGEFLRVLDNGRGVDINRALRSAQGDAIRNILGEADGDVGFKTASGAFRITNSSFGMTTKADTAYHGLNFDASLSVPTASENRPRSIAFPVWMTI